jgi:hypothetical protein
MERETTSEVKCPPVYKSYYNPLSLAGSFYSYEFGSTSESLCISQGSSIGVKTISIETGDEQSILALFEVEDIVNAFKKDNWVVESAKRNKINMSEIRDFKDVLNFPKDKLCTSIQFSSSSFCIVGFEDGIAQVKFIGRGYVGGNSYWHAPMSFELPVKKIALPFFDRKQFFYLVR